MDVSQMTDEALVDDCCVAFADAYDPSSGLLANAEAKVRWESHKFELLRRLAAAARPEQVTLAMCLEAVDTGVVFDDEITDMNVRDVRRILESVYRALAALWEATPQQDGAE